MTRALPTAGRPAAGVGHARRRCGVPVRVLLRAAARELKELLGLPLRYRVATLILLPILAGSAVFVRYNVSPSVPFTLAWIEYGRMPKVGEYMIYRYHGSMPGLPSHTFFKRVAGVASARIAVTGRTVWVDGRRIGKACRLTRRGILLTVVRPGRVPPGYVFAQGSDPRSFDSRYRESGLVPVKEIEGVAHPLF